MDLVYKKSVEQAVCSGKKHYYHILLVDDVIKIRQKSRKKSAESAISAD